MFNPDNKKSSIVSMLAESFVSYVEMRTLYSAMILEKMLISVPDAFPGETDDQYKRIKKTANLIMLLPEETASEILGEFRCFTSEDDTYLLDTFVFEIARTTEFDISVFMEALSEFAAFDSSEPFGGIDKARIITEGALGTQRTIDCINRLTDSLTATADEIDGDKDRH